jgi:hypothetical protein
MEARMEKPESAIIRTSEPNYSTIRQNDPFNPDKQAKLGNAWRKDCPWQTSRAGFPVPTASAEPPPECASLFITVGKPFRFDLYFNVMESGCVFASLVNFQSSEVNNPKARLNLVARLGWDF